MAIAEGEVMEMLIVLV